jgi:hypothetical protein
MGLMIPIERMEIRREMDENGRKKRFLEKKPNFGNVTTTMIYPK